MDREVTVSTCCAVCGRETDLYDGTDVFGLRARCLLVPHEGGGGLLCPGSRLTPEQAYGVRDVMDRESARIWTPAHP